MKIWDYMDSIKHCKKAIRKPSIYDSEEYSEMYRICRERWNTAPIDIAKICRIAARLKDAGYTIQEIKESDKLELTEKYLKHKMGYTNTDKSIFKAIGKYKAYLDYVEER